MSKITINIDDVSVPGVLSIGSQMRIFSLGNGIFVLATTMDLRDELAAIFEDGLTNQMRETLGAKNLLLVHSDDRKLGKFVPLGKSEDLKALIRQMVLDVLEEVT